MDSITFNPLIPLAVWFPLAAAALVLTVVYAFAARKRLSGAGRFGVIAMMGVGAALPLLILLNPLWVEPVPPPAGKPRLTVLLDKTASMNSVDKDAEATRFVSAMEVAKQINQQLSTDFDVRFHAIGDAGGADLQTLSDSPPTGAITNLSTAIEDALEDRPAGQALLLISDGVHNAGGGAERVRRSVAKARAMAAPIYTRTVGGEPQLEDLSVEFDLPQELAFLDQTIHSRVTVRQRGTLADRVALQLLLDGDVVDEQTVEFDSDSRAQATFQLSQDATGLYRYEVRIQSDLDEATKVNNVASLLLNVVDEPVRVLVLEGKPYWDTKFLLRTLGTDAAVDVTSIVRMNEERFLERRIRAPAHGDDKAPPSTAPAASGDKQDIGVRSDQWRIHKDPSQFFDGDNELASFQIVVLGRDAEVFLNDAMLAGLQAWLSDGDGSLVCYRGPPFAKISQRLGDLMPVRWEARRESRFRVSLTETGRSMRWLSGGETAVLAQLPSLASVNRPDRPKPLAVVLATAITSEDVSEPVITYQPVGNGRVVVVEGAGMWRWAFLAPEHQQYEDAYGLLWRSLTRWLASNTGLLPTQQAALRSDKTTFQESESAMATLLLRLEDSVEAESPQIELVSAAGEKIREVSAAPTGDAPGHFRADFGKLGEGVYRARYLSSEGEVAAETGFDVRGNLSERLDLDVRPDLMRVIADESGGLVLEDDLRVVASDFEAKFLANHPQRLTKTTIWDRWWVLTGVLLIWTSTWIWRRRTGLV